MAERRLVPAESNLKPQTYKNDTAVPEAQLDGCVQWVHPSSGHTGCNRSVDVFRERFYSRLTCVELRAPMQSIVDSCGCHTKKQSNSRERGLVSSLPTPYCANALLYVDFIHSLPKFGGGDSCLVFTCGLTVLPVRFPGTKRSQGNRL